MNLNEIYRTIDKEIQDVNGKIKETIPKKSDPFRDACLQILNVKSKKIRPALVLLCSKMLNIKGQKIITFATAVELFHTATLVHDDIIDKSTLRRGEETVNVRFGVNSAILVADFLYLNGAVLLNAALDGNTHLNKQLSKLVLSTAHKMFSGELTQLLNNSVSISRKEYFEIINQKTASFFSACCTIPALLKNSNTLQKRALLLFGRNLGMAFQIMDDVLDIIGDEKIFGKRRGSDIKDGFFTLPFIHYNDHATRKEKKQLLEIILKKRKNMKKIIELLNKYDSIKESKKIARMYSSRAKKNLSIFQDSEPKRSLSNLCDFVVGREY